MVKGTGITLPEDDVSGTDNEPISMTEAEAAAAAVQSWDVSAAQDGSITMYKVPNGDDTYTMYVFGVGPIKDFPTTASPYTPWQDNTDITSVYIDEGITAVGNLCFYRFLSLINVELPSTVQRIGNNAFNTCEKLSNITLPEGLHIIDSNSFVRCYELSSIDLPEGLVSIGGGAFYQSGLESITIPDSVTTLGDQVFAECSELTNAYFGSGISSLGVNCFRSCDKMEYIEVSDDNSTFISANGILYDMANKKIVAAPPNISGIIEIPYGIKEIPENAFKCCEKFEGIIIPDSVTSIGQAAFNYAESLKSVFIPASVTTIGRQAFQHCYSLESIIVDANNPNYCSDEYGVLYTKDMKELHCFPAALQLSSYTIPSTVKHIWARAFGGNPYISGTITVPANCEVGFGAFSGCRNLEKVVWKTSPKATEPYVHENVCPVNQKPDALCAACSIDTAINTFTGLTYNKEEWREESNRLYALGYNAGINGSSYGLLKNFGENFFNYYGIELEIIKTSTTGFKNTIIEAVSEGKMVVFNAMMERPKSGYDGSGSQHIACIFGISDEGYFYVYDPSYPDAPMTQYDPELLFNCAYGNTYILSAPTDTTMKTTQISAEASTTIYPDSYTFTAAEGEKLGSTNGDSTYLAKSSDWTNYQNGTASTSLRFAYEPEATDYIYVLDYSESMTRSTVDEDYTNMSVEKTLAYESIEELLATEPTARVSIVSFRGLNEAVCSEFTNNTSDIYDIIANERCQGFTCFADGFDAALEAINSRTGEDANRKAVVVFATDGNRNVWVNNDDMSYVTYEVDIAAPVSGDTNFGASEAAALRAAGAEIYAVVLNPDISDVAEAKMAEITDDEDKVFVAGTIEELGEAFCDIIDDVTLRDFTITDVVGSDFVFDGGIAAAEGTSAEIGVDGKTVTWTLENILPNTEYTLSFNIKNAVDSKGMFVTGTLPTNEGNAVVTEDGETVNSVETPVLEREETTPADPGEDPVVDPEEPEEGCSLTLFKWDISKIATDELMFDFGEGEESVVEYLRDYQATGESDEVLEDLLSDGDETAINHNSESEFGYAIKGVQFSYIKIGTIGQKCVPVAVEIFEDEEPIYVSKYMIVYGVASSFEDQLGLEEPVYTEDGINYYTAEQLQGAVDAALEADPNGFKTAMESFAANMISASASDESVVAGNMPLTDAHGKTVQSGLETGIYLIVETSVPEKVVSTTNPFIVSIPMMTDGENWNYNVTAYPKNETGVPTLEKTVREDARWTGEEDGAFAHTATASQGDYVEYQIISKFPNINSEATYLSKYEFTDVLPAGLTMVNDEDYPITVTIYSDAECTNLVETWEEGNEYTVTNEEGTTNYVFAITETGLEKVNTLYANNSIRIGYFNKMTDPAYGNAGNTNTVTLEWERTTDGYYDQLIDDCHVYTYGITVNKEFTDGEADYSDVAFLCKNTTDNVWINAAYDADEGVWKVTGFSVDEANATELHPNDDGIIRICGLEDDTYEITEAGTSNGYTLLLKPITVTITTAEGAACTVYELDTVGVINEHAHNLLVVEADVDGNELALDEETDEFAEMTIVNDHGFRLPATGENGLWMYGIGGMTFAALAVVAFLMLTKKKQEDSE